MSTLARVRRIGYAVLVLELAGFAVWSGVLHDRYALTFDFATYDQPWFLIAHGNLDPYSTLAGLPFWQNDSEFMPWILAPLYWVWRNDLWLLWLQDISVVGAEAIAFTWMCQLAGLRCRDCEAAWLAGLGLVLLVINPWVWWTVSFDVHEEPLVIGFTMLLAWDLGRLRRRAWAWVLPVLAGGLPSATYLAGIGLGGVIADRRSRAAGAAMMLIGIGYTVVLVLMHGDAGVPLPRHYGYLAATGSAVPLTSLTLSGLVKGIVTHPLGVLRALWAKRVDGLANLAPSGLLGLGAPIVAPLTLLIFLENNLNSGLEFSAPLFQSLPIYLMLPVGTVSVLCWAVLRHRRLALLTGGVLLAQAVGWAVVWGPRTSSEWLRVSAPTAATLAAVEAKIPASAEVIASQGIVGPFARRTRVYGLNEAGSVPVVPVSPVCDGTWVVIAPQSGIETLSTASSMALIGELAGPLHATLVTHANGVWAFRWTPPPGVQAISVPGDSPSLPAWAAAGVAGRAVMTGSTSAWHVASTGGSGYVADELEWQVPPGRYRAVVSLSTTGPVNVEVWNDTGNVLLARRTLPATDGVQAVWMPVDARIAYRPGAYSGWGPFRAAFTAPPADNRLEVRVWSPGGSVVDVYTASLGVLAEG